MPGSTFGNIFKISTFGESHGGGVGVIIDGCPAGIVLDLNYINNELKRRRPGQSSISSQRKEADEFEILSGLYENKTLGSPIAFLVKNTDTRAKDYESWGDIYRPSHADYTYHIKYGHRTPLGGGRASVRESIGRVIAGAVASQILYNELGIKTLAWVERVGEINSKFYDNFPLNLSESVYKNYYEKIEATPVRCPDLKIANQMIELIESVRKNGDSIGGVVGLACCNVPPGLGEPVFNKLEAELAKAMLSIPACKGFVSGSGFEGTLSTGSKHNDLYYNENKIKSNYNEIPILKTHTNNSGGIQGGISNGMPIKCLLAFKPTATIFHEQESVNEAGESVILKAKGRHDPCVLPRAVPIVEAMANLVLIDAFFMQRALNPNWWERFRKINFID